MRALLVFSVLLAAVWADPSGFSFSPAVGGGSGTSYTILGDGRITAVRIWDNGYIRGLQVRYGFEWSQLAGFTGGTELEFELFDGEFIVQVSGKFSRYIQSLFIVTNRGRSMIAGQPSGTTFNMYAVHPMAELRFLSGRYNGGLTSIATHWAILPMGNMAVNGTSD
ncbi:zymogen granule membrane protein 16-like [Alosa sapidissima]|uniref:zymogen granule membrane protein 16-like n=1 Tax=Alosa sapidissima TaxID=34773 RepID=UPI001C08BC72|nr:zymogen granule membrane protein 16-like [Alosa sapidissima]